MILTGGVERWWNSTDRGEWSVGGMILTGETEVLGETCTTATWSMTGLTCTVLGSYPDFRGERTATNRPNHDTVSKKPLRLA